MGGDVTDWNGRVLRKGIFDVLKVGDWVRVPFSDITEDGKIGAVAAPYFEITKIKDGTFWGKATDTYNTLIFFYDTLEEGQVLTFRAKNISEIPVTWQSKRQQRRMEKF